MVQKCVAYMTQKKAYLLYFDCPRRIALVNVAYLLMAS
jgi:hypothetical protein